MAVGMLGPYETYCYVIGDTSQGIWGGNYFEATRARKNWPPEMSQCPREPTYEETMRKERKATVCMGCGQPFTPVKHRGGLRVRHGKDWPCPESIPCRPHLNVTAPGYEGRKGEWNPDCYKAVHPEQTAREAAAYAKCVAGTCEHGPHRKEELEI
jgi:hypothetical protein